MKNRFVIYIILGILCFSGSIYEGSAQNIDTKTKLLIRQADRMASDGNLDSAKSIYKELITLDSLSKYGNYGMGQILLKEKNSKEAFKYFSRIVDNSHLTKIERNNLMHNMGNAMYMQKKYKDAINYFENALIANPNDNGSRYNLVMAQKMLQKQQNNKNNKDNKDNKDKNKNDKNKKNNKNKNDNKDKNNNNNKDNKDNKQNKDNQNNDNKNNKQPNNNNQNPNNGKNNPQNSKQEANKEEAKQILKSFRQDDDKVRAQLLQRSKQRGNPSRNKNW